MYIAGKTMRKLFFVFYILFFMCCFTILQKFNEFSMQKPLLLLQIFIDQPYLYPLKSQETSLFAFSTYITVGIRRLIGWPTLPQIWSIHLNY